MTPPAVPMLLSVLLFGASVPCAKLLLAHTGPTLLAGLLYAGSGLGLAALRVAGGRLLPRQASLRGADLPWLAGAVLAGGVAAPVLLMMGLRDSSATSASLLLNLEALGTMAIAWAGGREHPGPAILLGAGLILAGSVALSWHGGAIAFGPGSLLIAGACGCWAIDNTLTRRLSAADPVQIAMVKGLAAGGVTLTLALLVLHETLPGRLVIAAAGALGLAGYGVSLVLFIVSLRHFGVARASAYFACAPFAGAALSVLFLHEAPTPAHLVAALLMAAGLWLHVREQHDHEHTHEVLDHDHPHVHDAHHRHAHQASDPPGEPHVHPHRHTALTHTHRHLPDLHHRHRHRAGMGRPGDSGSTTLHVR